MISNPFPNIGAISGYNLLHEKDIVALIPCMAAENLAWGCKHIFDELKKLGISVALITIRYILLENLVFIALRRITPEIFYYKTKTGRELDLVALLPSVPGQERTILLVQVCASLADPRIRQSEVCSLSEAMVYLAVAEGTIVTWRTDETIPVGFGTIQVVPVWQFLPEMEARA